MDQQFTLTLSKDDVDFLFNVLTTTPLPYVRVAPLVAKIGGQVQAQVKPENQALDPQ